MEAELFWEGEIRISADSSKYHESNLASFQKSHSVQSFLNVWYLFVQADFPSLGIDFHKLVLSNGKTNVFSHDAWCI